MSVCKIPTIVHARESTHGRIRARAFAPGIITKLCQARGALPPPNQHEHHSPDPFTQAADRSPKHGWALRCSATDLASLVQYECLCGPSVSLPSLAHAHCGGLSVRHIPRRLRFGQVLPEFQEPPA